ncbi:MAG: 16S rRNA pseudouridine(516) synthase [Myxococcaceae bacterium]|nr:16S rRNA pseudouridine(516) synthase [Myxococcaceae bacterium]
MKLEKVLQSQGFGSRKQCRALIEGGRVRVSGQAVDSAELEVTLEGLALEVDGVTWSCAERVYLALHKPIGVECSHTPSHHASVFSLLPSFLVERGVQTVGRLDADTSGLLLLSDDGPFIQRQTSPKWKVPKVYEVTCAEPVTAGQLERLRVGVVLSDDPSPASGAADLVDDRRLRLTITEGRYHQVRRMLAAVGNHVVALHRVAIGGFELPSELGPGAWVRITPERVGR